MKIFIQRLKYFFLLFTYLMSWIDLIIQINSQGIWQIKDIITQISLIPFNISICGTFLDTRKLVWLDVFSTGMFSAFYSSLLAHWVWHLVSINTDKIKKYILWVNEEEKLSDPKTTFQMEHLASPTVVHWQCWCLWQRWIRMVVFRQVCSKV